ncbi:hypothetical protein [Nonomuraea salmonea]|uniref:hypothetical protein n=1 Tax=Nonomuraea salmonea TaxID=46181 RepID=UPI002FEDB137
MGRGAPGDRPRPRPRAARPPYAASLRGFATDIALARGDHDRAARLLDSSRRVLARGAHRDQHVLPHLRREVLALMCRGQLGEAVAAALRGMEGDDLINGPPATPGLS